MGVLGVRGSISNDIGPTVSKIQLSDVLHRRRKRGLGVDCDIEVVGTIWPPGEDGLEFGDAVRLRYSCTSKEVSIVAQSVCWRTWLSTAGVFDGWDYSRDQTSTIVFASGLQVVISIKPTSRVKGSPLSEENRKILETQVCEMAPLGLTFVRW